MTNSLEIMQETPLLQTVSSLIPLLRHGPECIIRSILKCRMYYQKYSEMSVYANVDLSHVKNPDIDGCDSSGDFVDGCSGMSYQDLTSVDPNSIDETKLYQEGTQDWIDKKIQDING